MTPSTQRWLGACLRSGTLASLLSGLAIVWGTRRDSADAAAGINAPSHWVWGDEALGERGLSRRYTATGALIHHTSSLFWAALYATWCERRRTPTVVAAATVASAAAWVDLQLVPHRLSPGFQHLLRRRNLAAVYAAFGLGLLLGSVQARRLP
jgi:hypothetical protein